MEVDASGEPAGVEDIIIDTVPGPIAINTILNIWKVDWVCQIANGLGGLRGGCSAIIDQDVCVVIYSTLIG